MIGPPGETEVIDLVCDRARVFPAYSAHLYGVDSRKRVRRVVPPGYEGPRGGRPAEWWVEHGCPAAVTAVSVGAPRVAPKVFCALCSRIPRYMKLLDQPPGSPSRTLLVDELRRVLPSVLAEIRLEHGSIFEEVVA